MPDAMQFPESWKQFLHDYQFRDSAMKYTNGAMLIPSFRVAQMVGHYFQDAAPVVRCGECRHCKAVSPTVFVCCHPGGSCHTGGMRFIFDSDYCSRGERDSNQSADVRNMGQVAGDDKTGCPNDADQH